MLPPSSCQMMTLFIGVTGVCFMQGPVGDCMFCCPRGPDDVLYKLYTSSNPDTFQTLSPSDVGSLRASSFDPANPTVIYIFGYSEAATGRSTTTIKNAFMQSGNFNFIVVDWSRLVAAPWYPSAVRNTRLMGQRLAQFVMFLEGSGVPASTLHVVGFSLGAEAAGFAGKALRARGVTLGRITGLDPAYPGYSLTNPSGHLSKGDAAFVDVVHTNPGLFGFPLPIGDVDFYPNHGQWIQPGCKINELLTDHQLQYIYGCSHNRAWRLFAESVLNPRGFPATLCPDWKSGTSWCSFQVNGYMGYGANPTMVGKMYLETRSTAPFAKNGP